MAPRLLPAQAASPQAFLQQFGPAEGLSQLFIYCLLQDRQGYLWLGTSEGLVRYDGTRFVTFTTRDGLADNFVTSLREDPATGQLWVAHYHGARSVRRAAGGRFRAARPGEGGAWHPPTGPPPIDTARLGRYQRRYRLGLPAEVAPSCLLEDREGNAWLGTAGQGLWRHADRFLSLWPTLPRQAPLVLGSLPTAGGAQAWATFDNSFFYHLPTAPAGQLTATNPCIPPVPGGPARVLLARPAALGGGFWLGTRAGSVWAVAAPGQPAELVPGLGGGQGLGSAVTALAYAPSSGLWVGTQADGVYYLPTPKAGRPAPGVRHFTTASGLLHNSTTALLADRRGRIWLAAPGTGLANWQPGQPHFTYYRLAAGGLNATTLAEDADGTIWVGTEGQGLFYQRAGRGRWQHLQAPGALPSDYVVALQALPAPLASQLLLVHPQGLSLLDTRRATAQPLTAATDPLGQGGLPGPALATHPALAWLATRAGLLRLDLTALPRQPVALAPPGLAFTGAEVDGEAHPAQALGSLSPRQHRVSFAFQGISLAAGGGGALQYRYRLRGLADEWSRPSLADEAQFAGLGPGRYELQVQVRRPAPGAAWSPPLASAFRIATPWWRQGWVAALGALLALGLLALLVRAREATLRRQKYQLEHTVRERTAELRQRQHHIERINAELLVARDAAEASRRAKAQFLANMSHEIRTPMNAVIGLTNLLRETNPTPEQQEYLGAIGSSSHNLLVILNDILDSSKMEAGKLTLEQAPFALPALVQGLGTMFRHTAASKGLALSVVVDPAVPAAVLGDSVRLQQVLVNLVSNALKFTRQGGVRVSVAPAPGAALDAGHAVLRFAVQDTGIGIPADKLTTIFEDFSQANTSTTREFGGTGLGLSIARNLVQLHGGQLTVQSEVGVGSVFSFELPYALADEALLHATTVATGPLPPFAPGLRVLVAEDNALNQLVARKTLENWHVHVTMADNGRLAVEQALAATVPFDAVLMDVQMPELDGYAATRLLRERFPDAAALPIIGLTASVLPEDRTLALAVGMNDILAKPFEPATLHARLAYFTGRATGPAGTAPSPLPPPQSPAPAALPRPSWQQLEELAGGNEQFVQQIVRTFLEQAPALELLLPEAYPHDPATLAQLAHKLKGQVAYFGVPGLHAQLDELERAARQPGCPYGAALIQSVRQQLAHLYPLLAERA
ncbi:response regulator [Hymenobacter sp. RP-2-7]|uniref:histidine kinase n=1 Tax=Hymenobacter polaris TaxID=2682546 RepID=A0A7Y0FPJ0_9BACT|nr:hybrid sensor histidine kinase/response regulator [Hymenobacter polaris]NML67424.1 response regulator [Hymenobacter polaris]